MSGNYTAYHVHTELSLLDSATKFEDYIAKAVELGQTAIAFTEHGNIYQWVAKKMACDKAGLKYLHGCEVYLTEKLLLTDPRTGEQNKVRDNYHTILIAKNYTGLQEMNELISRSSQDDHFYYKPRITFDEFLGISSKLRFESQFQKLSPGGAISYIEVANLSDNIPAVLTVLKYIYDNIMYAELNTKSDYCQVCGWDKEIEIVDDDRGKLIWKCPNCGNTDKSKMNIARRTCGYIGLNDWNQGRTQEIKERYVHLGGDE